MANGDTDQKNGAPPHLRPADELPFHPIYHRGDPKAAQAFEAINVIPLMELKPGDVPVLAVCPYCQEDLSTITLGRFVETPQGRGVQALFPLGCPKCKHPFLYMATSPIVTPHGR